MPGGGWGDDRGTGHHALVQFNVDRSLLMRSTPIITGLVFVAAGAYVVGVATLLLWLSGDWRWVEVKNAALVPHFLR